MDRLPDELESVGRLRHRVNSGADVGPRRRINWPASVTLTDDSVNKEVHWSIATGPVNGSWATLALSHLTAEQGGGTVVVNTTASAIRWVRNGDIVTVDGYIEFDATTAGTAGQPIRFSFATIPAYGTNANTLLPLGNGFVNVGASSYTATVGLGSVVLSPVKIQFSSNYQNPSTLADAGGVAQFDNVAFMFSYEVDPV